MQNRDEASIGRVGKGDALGESEAFIDFQSRLSEVAKVERPVLIVGERGTGKELAVSRLHYLSQRWQGPLVSLNASALSPSVLESELFGHEAGAFTGASRRREGRFEAADGGTLFLDEIGLIPVQVQEKILRVVEYGQFERVGGSRPIEVDVRIVGATNANLPRLASEGKFKRDLLDRLSFEVLFLPPLRAREEDILLLARHFSVRMARELGRSAIPEFSEQATDALIRYPWPGNVRELKNVIERAVYAAKQPVIEEVVFDPFQNPYAEGFEEHPGPGEASQPKPSATEVACHLFESGGLDAALREVEVAALRWALKSSQFHQGEAAEKLGLTYHQFRGLYRKHKADIEEPKESDG